MATFRLRSFSCPDTLRAIAPERLLALLEPHRRFLTSRGVGLPLKSSADQIDYEGLVRVLMSPDSKTPGDLIDACCVIDEMATPHMMDVLQREASRQGLSLDPDPNPTPADVAVQVWLLDRDLLERKHAEQLLTRRRPFESYQSRAFPPPPLEGPSALQLRRLEKALDEWFESKKRGRGVRVLPFPREDGVWFLVRHGDPFRREESLEEGEPACVCFRPLKYDVLVYQPATGELRIKARSKAEKDMYRAHFGQHLFGDRDFFPGSRKYTLEPLRTYGEASLTCRAVPGIEEVRLTEIYLFWGGAHNDFEVHKADDVFAALKARDYPLPESPSIIRAVFSITFKDSKRPRSVTLRPPNIVEYTRDDDAPLVEEFLRRQQFILKGAIADHEAARVAVASD